MTPACGVCGEEGQEMATAVCMVVEDGRQVGKTTRALPYCLQCQRKSFSPHGDKSALKHQMAMLYEDMLRADWKAGDGEKKCNRCKAWKPTTLFAWHQGRESYGTGRVWRRGTCHSCVVLNVGRADAPASPAIPTPFEIARALIEKRSGLPIERWTQPLHEAHCLLMRDLCKLSHHQRVDEERNHVPSRPHEESQWVRKLNIVKSWLRSSTASSSVSSPSNNGLMS